MSFWRHDVLDGKVSVVVVFMYLCININTERFALLALELSS